VVTNAQAPDELPAGLYERLVTRALARIIEALGPGRTEVAPVDEAEAADVLARHLGPIVRRALRERRGAKSEDDEEESDKASLDPLLDIINKALQLVGDEDELVQSPARLLTAVIPAPSGQLVAPRAPRRPGIPLSSSALLVNAREEHRIGVELIHELESAEHVDLVCSFVKWSGLRVVEPALRAFRERGGELRVLTTAYLAATEARALDALCGLGAKVRISYDTRRTRLHAKAWLFRRRSGYTTAYVGSSNLSAAALLDGLEWNVRLSAIETPQVVEKFASTFEAYWADAEFESYEPSDRPRFEAAVNAQRADFDQFVSFDVRPFPYQQEILDRLDAERTLHHSFRNLVVAATGTGKTVIAALDYRRARERHGVDSLIFIAHRKEILTQSRRTFRAVMGDGSFGELRVDGDRPAVGKHVFASIQSLHHLDLEKLAPDAFDYVVVDEFHHAEADSYARILKHLRPKVLLGLTATPERADGRDVKHWFGDRVAAELRLWLALERGLLCPFQYFGHHDETDLSQLPWTRGGYDSEALEQLLTGNDVRDRIVLKQLQDKIGDVSRMRALGFCASVKHAKHMAEVFTKNGIPATSVDAETPREKREEALRLLRDRKINALFAVDLFNEGVDVPQIDTVLFLRPTESVTVFLQQLGRGLRLADDKPCLTVLDFVGQAHRRFRFDLRFRALTGATRAEVMSMVEQGFPVLPPGCAIHLDRVATDVVLKNIKTALGKGLTGLARELVEVARHRGRTPTMTEFLDDSMLELDDLYGKREHGWTATRRRAAAEEPSLIRVPAGGPNEAALQRMIPGLLHVADPERLRVFREVLLASTKPDVSAMPVRDQRAVAMLYATFWKRNKDSPANLDAAVARLRQEPALLDELRELFDQLERRAALVTHAIEGLAPEIPIRLHAQYSKDEVLAAFGRLNPSRYFRLQSGVFYEQGTNTNLFFPTIHKSERDYSPMTMYRDFAIAPDIFHWESQSSTRVASEVGQRYTRARDFNTNTLMFVRRRMRDERGIAEAYTCLGLVDYLSHEGERPIAITWRLRVPMPASVFAAVRLTAA
jgi:superfamily II DNA or RNA helicase